MKSWLSVLKSRILDSSHRFFLTNNIRRQKKIDFVRCRKTRLRDPKFASASFSVCRFRVVVVFVPRTRIDPRWRDGSASARIPARGLAAPRERERTWCPPSVFRIEQMSARLHRALSISATSLNIADRHNALQRVHISGDIKSERNVQSGSCQSTKWKSRLSSYVTIPGLRICLQKR